MITQDRKKERTCVTAFFALENSNPHVLYCSEGHDNLTASNVREALQKHPVKGTTTSVNVVDESQQNLLIKKLDHLSSFPNFHFYMQYCY